MLMWGDNLPHTARVLCFFQCLRFRGCLRVSSFVSTGCKACQIIIDASLESISYSTNKATLAEINMHQSDKTRNRCKSWGLTATGEKMTDEMNKRPVRWVRCVYVHVLREPVLLCTCHQWKCWVLTGAWKPPQVLVVIPSPLLFSRKKCWQVEQGLLQRQTFLQFPSALWSVEASFKVIVLSISL